MPTDETRSMRGSDGAASSAGRFAAWYHDSRYGQFITRRLDLGATSSQLIEVGQPRGTYTTPGTNDLVLGLVLNPGVQATMDFGAGAFGFASGQAAAFVSPSGTASTVDVDSWHHTLLLSIPQHEADRIYRDANLGGVAAFGGLHARGIADPFIAAALQRMADLADDGEANTLLADSITLSIVLSLARLARVNSNKGSPPHRGGLAPFQLRLVEELLASNLSEDISLGDAARLIGQSTFYFCRAFKLSTGLSPYRWRQQRRISYACDLLMNSRLNIDEIARAIGYGSVQAFGKVFRREMGVTPSAYRGRAR